MGKRLLRQYILHPITNKEILDDRLDAVEYFYNNTLLTSDIRDSLNSIADIERITGRLGTGSINPKDIRALGRSLEELLRFIKLINQTEGELPTRLSYLIRNIEVEKVEELINLINKSIKEDPPTVINEGGIFTEGYNERIDELRSVKGNAKGILKDIQERESKRNNIPSLKISFNRVFGYYIEVTKTHIDKVPADYIRKQTLANAERFITEELKEIEDKILNSDDELIKLEFDLYKEFIEVLAKGISIILKAASVIGEIDVLSNFGHIAKQYQYTKPELLEEDFIEIIDGRHPVVEQTTKEVCSL
ncbi:MAG: hypothetical protein Q9M91_07630 [Candidatus Dojkabacteria bacterium]|nr:hypothetical protein [Candidatus Dojkabacteria bacterium]